LLEVHPEPFDFPQGHEQVEWSRFLPHLERRGFARSNG
jgi:hypothetical protein